MMYVLLYLLVFAYIAVVSIFTMIFAFIFKEAKQMRAIYLRILPNR